MFYTLICIETAFRHLNSEKDEDPRLVHTEHGTSLCCATTGLALCTQRETVNSLALKVSKNMKIPGLCILGGPIGPTPFSVPL